MRLIHYIFLLFIFNTVLGRSDSLDVYKNQVKLSPLRLITMVRGIQISYERQFSDKFSTQLTANYIIDLLPHHFSDLRNMSGYAVGIEEKYFLKKEKGLNNYVSVDFNYLNCILDTYFSFYRKVSDSLYLSYIDTITVKRSTYTFSIKRGMQFRFKHFTYDLNVGLGIRYRDVANNEKLYKDGMRTLNRHYNIPRELFTEGKYFTFNVPLGLKVGYTF